MSVGTDSTTNDTDSSLTGVFCMSIDSSISIFSLISISTYRTVCTATIYIMENSAAINSNISVTLDETDSDVIIATETAAIDVTILSTAIDSLTILRSSDSTAVHKNVRTAIYCCQRTTTINRPLNSGCMTFNIVTNRDVRVTCNRCRRTETTTKDISCDSTIVDVYHRIVFITIGGCIGSLVTTAIDIPLSTVDLSFTEVHGTSIDINSYRTLRSTVVVITTKDVINATT